MPVALKDFVKHLEDSGVVSASKLQRFLPPQAAPKDAQELAKELVRSKTLTRYQAQEIYLGRARALILGSYTILDKIGAGGMGQVFKAQHRRMDRIVAIKMLPAAVTKDAAAVARFERETKAAAKLEHPNIVTAHDADESGGVHFLVMQYVEGSDLSVLVKKNGPFGVEKVVDYILQAARGLAYAHEQGVVHRDIKPANLLLDAKGTVKILDMGLARLENSVGGDAVTAAELTASGTIMGTVDYMAPEQALNTKHADARSDVYSLGCTLHYLLAGKAPFAGETLMEKLLAHREQPVPELAAGSSVPGELQTVFEQMIAKDPAERYASMNEVVQALEDCRGQLSAPSIAPATTGSNSGASSPLTFLRNLSPTARKPATGTTKKPSATRIVGKGKLPKADARGARLRPIALGAGVLLLVVAGIAGWRAWHANVPAAPAQAMSETMVVKPLDSLDPAQIPASERFKGQPPELVAVLGEQRGFLGGDGNFPAYLSMRPDGAQLASYTNGPQGIMLWDPQTLKLVKAFEEPSVNPWEQIRYTPDGKSLASIFRDRVKLWDVSGSDPKVRPGVPGESHRMAFSPDKKTAAVAMHEMLWLVDLTTQSPTLSEKWSMPAPVHSLEFLGHGECLATSGQGGGGLFLWDVSQPAHALLKEYPLQGHIHSMAVSPDGKTLATGGADFRLWKWKNQSLEEIHSLAIGGPVDSIAFSTDGCAVAAACTNSMVHVLDVSETNARPRMALSTGVHGAASVQFTNNADRLVTVNNGHVLRLWDVSSSTPHEMLLETGHRGQVTAIAFSPDGQRLASGGLDQTVRLWDLTGASPKQQLLSERHKSFVTCLGFSPSGKTLATGSSFDHATYLWDLTEREPGPERLEMWSIPHAYLFGADDGLLAVARGFGNGGPDFTDFVDGKPVGRKMPQGWSVHKATFSPDGKTVAYCLEQKVMLVDLSGADGKEITSLESRRDVVSFSIDGDRLVIHGPKGLAIYDTAQWSAAPRILHGPDWPWTTATFSADRQLLFAADAQGRVMCWSSASDRPVRRPGTKGIEPVFWQLPGEVRQLALSPDGRHLASANGDGTIYILRLDESSALAAAAEN